MLPFFFMHPATTAIYTLSLHDALPICRIGRVLERGRGVIDDRPEDILLGGDVGVEAGALDVECAGDVANARRRVAVGVEQLAGDLVDLATAGARFDHRPMIQPNDR